jgi:hypothetical protein
MRARLQLPVLLLCLTLVTSAEAAGVGMVFTAPGEDARTQIHVSWHASAPGTRLEYTTTDDPAFANATVADGIVETHDTSTFADAFYRASVLLEDLAPGTDYLLRVGDATFTPTHHVRTASGHGAFSFIFMSDVHAYPPIPSRVSRAEGLVDQAGLAGDSSFILFTGDLAAHGANYTHWENLAAASFVRDYVMATSPGNHDYYNSSAATIDDRFYNAMYKNPDNGAALAQNTAYWFRYHDTIFMSLNSEATSAAQIESQKAWMAEVMENNPAQYYVVYCHRAFFLGSTTIEGGGVVRKSSDTYPAYGEFLEDLGVDLVLAGHNHVWVRTKPIRGGAVAADGDGTVYITHNQIGDRGRMAASSLGEFAEAIYGGTTTSNHVSTIAVITIDEEAITGTMFDDGEVVRDTFTIPARRPPTVDDFDPEAYANAFSVRVNPPDLSVGVLAFSAEGHHRVDRIEVSDADATYASFTPAAGMTEALIGPLVPGRTYRFLVSVLLLDGGIFTVERSLSNKLDPGTVGNLRIETAGGEVLLGWDNDLVFDEIDRIEVEIDGRWRHTLPPQVDSADLTPGLGEGENVIVFTVIDRYEDVVFTEALTYVHLPEGTGDPDDAFSEGTWEPLGGGCDCASAPGFVLLFGLLGLMAMAKPRRAGGE